MTEFTGGQLVVATLQALGVEQLFSVSGGPINAIYDACADQAERGGPALRHVRSEAAAGFMAEACYRATGRPGVAVVTLGPGVTNTVTPCVSATLAGVPMLVLGGQAPLPVADRGAGMAFDTWSVLSTVTKWAARVLQPERIPEYVREAWRRAHAPTPGPVYLEIPADVLDATVSAESIEQLLGTGPVPLTRTTTRPDADLLAAVAQQLDASRRTLVVVGDDCFRTADRASTAGLVERYGAAFATLRLARGLLPDDHPRSIGPAYVPCNPVLEQALAEADTVLLLGHHWEFDLEFGAGVGPHTTVIQVDPDASRLGRNGPVDLAVCASAAGFLADLAQRDSTRPGDASWAEDLAEQWRSHRDRTAADAQAGGPVLHPVTMVEAVADAAPTGTIFVTSHGNVDFWADETLRVDGAGSYLRAGQSGTLGAEIPYGVAAALATGERSIVIVGDGGAGYAIAELDTAARYGGNVLVVVADDQQWTAIALPQARRFGRATELDLAGRDWVAVATGLGARARRADTAEAVRAAVKELLAEPGPALLHVPIRAVESPYMTHISK